MKVNMKIALQFEDRPEDVFESGTVTLEDIPAMIRDAYDPASICQEMLAECLPALIARLVDPVMPAGRSRHAG